MLRMRSPKAHADLVHLLGSEDETRSARVDELAPRSQVRAYQQVEKSLDVTFNHVAFSYNGD